MNKQKKWIAAALALAACLFVSGCGGGTGGAESKDSKENENLYSAEKTAKESVGDAKYRVPQKWAESSDVSDDGNMVSYWDEKNALIIAQVSDYEYSSLDELSKGEKKEEAKAGWLSGIKSGFEKYEEIATDFDSVDGLTAITVSANVETEEGDRCKFYQTSFAYNYKMYHFAIMAKYGIEKDYNQEFESLKSSIEIDRSSEEAKNAEATQDQEIPEVQKPIDTNTETPNPAPDITMGEANALKKAKNYLDLSAFSYQGIVEQLEYEKFSHEEAIYGADNCGADWNEQALKKAKSYLDLSAFSCQGIAEQLTYEGFTSEQAAYGADNCGADWNEQAAKKAKSYMELSSFSRDGLIEQLTYEGFTVEQATYGVDANGY